MKTYSSLLLFLIVALTLPRMACAQSKASAHSTSLAKTHHAKAATMYECPICHHKADAALAKKLHYVCPVDNGRLFRVKTASILKP